MEYITYVLVTLGIMAFCLLLMRVPRQAEFDSSRLVGRPQELGADKNQPSGSQLPATPRGQLILKRKLLNIPTPWGWPGHDNATVYRRTGLLDAAEVNGFSESLHRFAELLLHEKQTVDSPEFLIERDTSLRVMIEDRMGQNSKAAEIHQRKAAAPIPRDVQQAHDQMDNFQSGRLDKIMSRLPKQPSVTQHIDKKISFHKTSKAKELRTPWGW